MTVPDGIITCNDPLNWFHQTKKMDPPGVHMFYTGLYRENMKKSFCLKPLGLEP